MSRTIALPNECRPSNLTLAPEISVKYREHDLFDICRQLKALDESIYVVEMSEGQKVMYALMEKCRDGTDRLIFRTSQLDGRTLEKMRYLMHRPLHERMAEAEAMEYQWEAARKEDELEELYENLGVPMYKQLEHDGFIQRPRSYPKAGVAAPGRAR